jgi:hypothetical protein
MENKIAAERAEHVHLAVRPVHDADDAVHGGPSDCDERINPALRKPVYDLL